MVSLPLPPSLLYETTIRMMTCAGWAQDTLGGAAPLLCNQACIFCLVLVSAQVWSLAYESPVPAIRAPAVQP